MEKAVRTLYFKPKLVKNAFGCKQQKIWIMRSWGRLSILHNTSSGSELLQLVKGLKNVRVLGQHSGSLSTVPSRSQDSYSHWRHYGHVLACQAGRKAQRKKGLLLTRSSPFIWNQNPFQKPPEDFSFPLISYNSPIDTPSCRRSRQGSVCRSRMSWARLALISHDPSSKAVRGTYLPLLILMWTEPGFC